MVYIYHTNYSIYGDFPGGWCKWHGYTHITLIHHPAGLSATVEQLRRVGLQDEVQGAPAAWGSSSSTIH